MKAQKVIEIVHIESGAVVRVIDVSGKSERQIEQTERGILRNLNSEDYFTRVAERAK